MGPSAFLPHSNTCTHPSKPSLSQESSATCPRLQEMENTTGTQLGMPWPQHPPWDFNNKGHDADAWSGLGHLLSEQSQDHTMGKCAGLENKQTCIWIDPLVLPFHGTVESSVRAWGLGAAGPAPHYRAGETEGMDLSRSRDNQLRSAGLGNRTLRYGSNFASA